MLNNLKTFGLLAILTAILLAIGQLIGGTNGLYVALVFALLVNFFSFWFSDKIVLRIYKAKLAKESEYPKLHQIMRDISTRAGLPKPRLYVIPATHSNAFATGRGPKHSAIAVTEGILDLLDESELRGVLSHEMAHIKNRDILISSVAAVIAGAISYLAFFARFGAIFGGMGRDRDGGNILSLIALAILAPIIALLVRLAISRSREYLADATGAKIIKDSDSLANALLKLEQGAKHNPMRKANPATSHMMIINPFGSLKTGVLSLFQTHPPIHVRVGKLRAMRF